MASRHMRRFSTSLVSMSFPLTPVRMVIFKKDTSNKCWQGCGQKDSLFTVGEHCGKQYGGFSENYKVPYGLEIPLRGI